MIRYSTLQWVPRPDRGEFVNIAMIAWDEDGEIEVRQSNLERANRLGQMPDEIQEIIDSQLEPIARAASQDRTLMVQRKFEDHNNVMQFRVPMPTAYDSVDKVLTDLFPLLVGDD